jgi:hypothetical protein
MPTDKRVANGVVSMPLYDETAYYNVVKNQWFGLGETNQPGRGGANQEMVTLLSTGFTCPVIIRDSSDAWNSTTFAMSSGWITHSSAPPRSRHPWITASKRRARDRSSLSPERWR